MVRGSALEETPTLILIIVNLDLNEAPLAFICTAKQSRNSGLSIPAQICRCPITTHLKISIFQIDFGLCMNILSICSQTLPARRHACYRNPDFACKDQIMCPLFQEERSISDYSRAKNLTIQMESLSSHCIIQGHCSMIAQWVIPFCKRDALIDIPLRSWRTRLLP